MSMNLQISVSQITDLIKKNELDSYIHIRINYLSFEIFNDIDNQEGHVK